MRRILFGCVGAGLAIGGAYFVYKRWQQYQQQYQEKNNEPTLKKSDGGITEGDNIPVCAVQPAGTSSNGGETETTNVKRNLHTTADLDSQICHEESLKTENSSAKNDKTGHDVQHDQDLPLRTDGACNNTSNMSDANFNILGPSFTKISLEGTDKGALYGEMNEFIFAGVAKLMEARRVPRTDTDLTTVERGQNVKAGQSSYTFSPSTFVFHPNTDNQTNGTASKKASKQLESRRRRTRKHKRN